MKPKLGFLCALSMTLVALAALFPPFHLSNGPYQAAAQGLELSLDAGLSDGVPCDSINSAITVAPGEPFQVGVCLSGVPEEIAAFQFKITYDDTIISAPEIPLQDQALDDNPDANAGTTFWGDSLGENWTCNIMELGQQPVADNDPESGPGHGLVEMACWTLLGPSTLGDNEDAGVLAVISFNGHPSNTGTTTLDLADAIVGTGEALELGSCNPTISMEMDCNAATISVEGEPIAPEEWPTPTPATGEIERPVLPSGQPRATPTPGEEGEPEDGQAAEEPTAETEEGGNDWLWPLIIGIVVAVVVVGVLSLGLYLWRRRSP